MCEAVSDGRRAGVSEQQKDFMIKNEVDYEWVNEGAGEGGRKGGN